MKPRATYGDARQESRPLRALRMSLPPIPLPVERAARQKTIPLAPPRPDEPRPDEQRGKGSSIEQSPGWIASVLLHAFLLFVLTLIVPVASVGHRTVMVATFSEQESEAEVKLVDLAIVEQPEFEVHPIEKPIEIDKLFSDTEPVQSDILDQTIAIQRLIDPMSDSVFRSDSNALMRLPPQAFGSSRATGSHSSMAMIGVTGVTGSGSGVQGELGGRASRRSTSSKTRRRATEAGATDRANWVTHPWWAGKSWH